MKKVIFTAKAPAPIGPYNQAIQHKDIVYVSGQIAINPATGDLEIDTLDHETHLIMKNLGAVLNAAGMDYTNIVKCSIFLSSMESFGIVNEIYGSYFTDNFPARETVEVSCLPKHVNVEISCVAVAN